MKFTVYRQSSKTRPDGTIVYKGEDALPYIDDQIFFVADGLGGKAAIYHQKFDRDLFEEDKVLDVLFKDIFEEYDKEEFVKYVKDSFYELFAVKHCYDESNYNKKKSGYFASRIVTTVLLHEMFYNPEVSAEAMITKVKGAETEEAKAEVLAGYAIHFKELIQSNLRKIAKKVNFGYETSFSNLALLGSTLCASIYLETDDSVEVIYLTAGDSRPYAWQEEDGLCQLLPDEERPDGGMTNHILANEDQDFHIRVNHMSFKKPCILLNMSDGCFDLDEFFSPMCIEKQLLDTIVASENAEQAGEELTKFYYASSVKDDSSTIALKAFGYETYEQLKEACARRLAAMDEKYLSKMEDLLTVDYTYQREECDRIFPTKLQSLKGRFAEETAVKMYCRQQVENGKFPPYEENIRRVDAQIEGVRARIAQSKDAIKTVIVDDFIRFRTKDQDNMMDGLAVRGIKKEDDNRHQYAADYERAVAQYKQGYENVKSAIDRLVASVDEIGVPASMDAFDSIGFGDMRGYEARIRELFEFLNGLKNKKCDILRRLLTARTAYIEKNREFAKKKKDELDAACEAVIAGMLDAQTLDIPADAKAAIADELANIADAQEEIRKLEEETKKQIFADAMVAYWDHNYLEIILAIVNDPTYQINAELAEEAKALIAEYKTAVEGVEEKQTLQNSLFAEYDKVHYQYMMEKETTDGNDTRV